MIVVSKFLVPKGFKGLTIFPFVILKSYTLKEDVVLINHERIHLRQQWELLIIPFFILYGMEYLIRFLKTRNPYEAYRNISFEKEAYIKEKDLNYLRVRSFWSFIFYL